MSAATALLCSFTHVSNAQRVLCEPKLAAEPFRSPQIEPVVSTLLKLGLLPHSCHADTCHFAERPGDPSPPQTETALLRSFNMSVLVWPTYISCTSGHVHFEQFVSTTTHYQPNGTLKTSKTDFGRKRSSWCFQLVLT